MKRALTYLGCFSCSVLVVAIGFGCSLQCGPTSRRSRQDQRIKTFRSGRCPVWVMSLMLSLDKCNRLQERARDLFGKETRSSRNRGMCLNKDRTIR